MITAKEARKLSSCHPKYDGNLDGLLGSIEEYIKKECNSREVGLYYTVDSFKYSYAITKKAIKILRKKGFKITKMIENPDKPNFPKKVTLKIMWW